MVKARESLVTVTKTLQVRAGQRHRHPRKDTSEESTSVPPTPPVVPWADAPTAQANKQYGEGSDLLRSFFFDIEAS